MTLIRSEAAGGGYQALPFMLASIALTVGPGLFMWSTLRLSTDNVALFLSHILATSLGCSMLAPWLLLLCGLWTRAAAIGVAAGAGILGLAGLAMCVATTSARLRTQRGLLVAARSVTLSETLAIALAFAIGELLFELLAGYPIQGWDAYLSWDQWAAECAVHHSLGRFAYGFYPQGLPLVGSVFYRLLPATSGAPIPATTAHLLLHGLHAVFPLLMLLAVCALARPLGFNPLIGQAFVLSDFFLVQSMLKQAGDADVPLTAFCAAALVIALHATEGSGGSRHDTSLAAVPVIFALAFTKGTGLVMVAMVAFALTMLRPRPVCRNGSFVALAVGVTLAAPFYLHQGALAHFPALAAHTPFHLTLPLETAHTELFTPNVVHLIGWLRKAAPNLCLGEGDAISYVAVAIVTALVLAALASRRTFAVSLSSILWFVLWFLTGSYDWRNAFPAHMLACLAAAAALARLIAIPQSPSVRRTLGTIATVIALALLSRQRLFPLARERLAHRPVPPPILMLPEPVRVMRISSLGEAFELYHAVPFLKDAPHLRMPSRDYRLVLNGVRGIPYSGVDAFADPQIGDLCFARRSVFAATPDYIPIATLRGPRELGDTLHLLPDRHIEGGLLSSHAHEDTKDYTIQFQKQISSGFLDIGFPPDIFPNGIPDGFRVTRISPLPSSPADIALAERFDAIFQPIQCRRNEPWNIGNGPVLSCAFWFPNCISNEPALRLSASEPLPAMPILHLNLATNTCP